MENCFDFLLIMFAYLIFDILLDDLQLGLELVCDIILVAIGLLDVDIGVEE